MVPQGGRLEAGVSKVWDAVAGVTQRAAAWGPLMSAGNMLPGKNPSCIVSLGPGKLSLDGDGGLSVQSPSRWVQTALSPAPPGAQEAWMALVPPSPLTSWVCPLTTSPPAPAQRPPACLLPSGHSPAQVSLYSSRA